MNTSFIAVDPFEQVVEPSSAVPAVAHPVPTAGNTFWFDGDSTPFHQLVRDLQDSDQLPRSPLALPLPYLSVSQVEQYLKCPKQFEFRYIKGQKRPPGIAMVQGTVVHKAVEEGYRHVIASAELPELDFVLDTYSGALDAGLKEDVVWDDGEDADAAAKDPGALKDQGVALLKNWHREKLPEVKPTAVEKSFVTSFGGIPIVGRVDLIDRVEKPLDESGAAAQTDMHPLLDTVVDNKVVGKTYQKSKVDSALQMSLYAHATGIPRARYDLFVKTKTPKITTMLTSRNQQQINWAIEIFVQVARAISAGVFPPCVPDSFLCNPKWCGYWANCRGAV